MNANVDLGLTDAAQDKKQILMRNARQILEIITATFGAELFQATSRGNRSCEQPHNEIEELACNWQDIVATASNDDVSATLDPEWVEKISKVRAALRDTRSEPRLTIVRAVACTSPRYHEQHSE